MLSANVNRSCNIENAFVLSRLSRRFVNVDLYLVELLFLNIAVQEKRSVIFVVVCYGAKLCLLLLRCLSEFFKVCNQVFKLGHLNKLLYYIAGI